MSFLFALSVKGNWIMSRSMTVSSKSSFLQFERWFFNCDILRSAWPWFVSRSECQGYNRAAANTTQPGTGTSWSGPKLPGKLVHREQQQQAWCGLQSAWCMRVTRRMTASYEQHQHINHYHQLSIWISYHENVASQSEFNKGPGPEESFENWALWLLFKDSYNDLF